MGIYYVIPLLLINGTALFLFFLSVSPKIKTKNLSAIMVCLGINLITSPAAFLIGGISDYAGVAANYGAYFAGESCALFFGRISLHSGNTTPYTNCGFVEGCKSKENKLSIEVHDERVDSFLEEGSVFFLLSIIMRYVK